jgi:hypothetical protein
MLIGLGFLWKGSETPQLSEVWRFFHRLFPKSTSREGRLEWHSGMVEIIDAHARARGGRGEYLLRMIRPVATKQGKRQTSNFACFR